MIQLTVIGKDEVSIYTQIIQNYGKDVPILNMMAKREKGIKSLLGKKYYTATVLIDDDKKEVVRKTIDLRKIDLNKSSTTIQEDVQTQEIKKMISQTSEEIKNVQESFKEIQQTLSTFKPQQESIEKNTPLDILKESLLEENIHKNVVAYLLKDLKNEKPERYKEALEKKLNQFVLGQDVIDLPKVVCFVGTTGVGKTTTIAKVVAEKVKEGKKVVLFAADNYRIGATDQLQCYADILNIPLHKVVDEESLKEGFEKWKDVDHIFIDTAGRSHKNKNQMSKIEKLIHLIEEEKTVFLTLNYSTSYADMREIVDTYEYIEENFNVILTKLDETDVLGNIVNIAYYIKRPITYITNGQEVPKDIIMFNNQVYIKNLLRRLRYE